MLPLILLTNLCACTSIVTPKSDPHTDNKPKLHAQPKLNPQSNLKPNLHTEPKPDPQSDSNQTLVEHNSDAQNLARARSARLFPSYEDALPASAKAPSASSKAPNRGLPGWIVPSNQTARVAGTPDLMQTSPALHLQGGDFCCAPVSVTNAFIWLARRGYKKLAPNYNTSEGQSELARKLAVLMLRDNDTKANDLLHGIKKYIAQQGYEIQSISYEGCEKVDHEFLDAHKRPNLKCIEKALDDPDTVAILTVGFYVYEKTHDEYYPVEQHNVTLLSSCKQLGANSSTEAVFVIHDPSPRSGAQETDEFVLAKPLKHGFWQWDRAPLLGVYRLSGELKMPPNSQLALLEGVSVLKLKPLSAPTKPE